MALLFADGFDHYGDTETNMVDGMYASISETLSTAQVATGTHSLLTGGSTGTNGSSRTRFVLPTAKDKMGVCMKVYFPALPNTNTTAVPIDFLSTTSTTAQISCFVTSTGALDFRVGQNYSTNGGVGTLLVSSDPVIVASAWNFLEVQVYIHATDGWIRAAVNGVHVFEAEGLDTQQNATNIAQIGIGCHPFYGGAGTSGVPFYIDDLYAYDFVGDSAVDTDFVPTTDVGGKATNYIGEYQVIYLPPNGDTAETDWGRVSGSNDYEMVNEVDPDDATYIYGANVGDLSEFALTDLPPEITYIRGLKLIGRLSKADSGAAFIKYGMNSDGTTEDTDDIPITVEPTYWYRFMNVDPDSGARWTRASLNAAKFRITRSV